MKQKLIKQFENGTDFSICVIDMQNGTYVVTEYDFVNKKHELKGKYNDKNQALMVAKEINKSFKVLNESQLRKIIKESINNVLGSEKMLLQYHVKHNGRFEVKELIHVCDPNKTTQENLNDAYKKALKMGLVNDKQIRWKMIR